MDYTRAAVIYCEHPDLFDEFQEGAESFYMGWSLCPYAARAVNPSRYLWWRGYLSARAAHLL
jgi:hypothetical protein